MYTPPEDGSQEFADAVLNLADWQKDEKLKACVDSLLPDQATVDDDDNEDPDRAVAVACG